jgi:hypothetical protein
MCLPSTTTNTSLQSGISDTSSAQNKVSTPNPVVAAGATQNLATVAGLQNAGYTPYAGPRVADFSNLQNLGFSTAGNVGANGVPYVPTAQDLISGYSNAPAGSVNAGTISSAMSPYMNQYVSMALAPQLAAQNQQFAGQNKQLDAAATSSGAYGDSRAGIEASNLSLNQDLARQGLVGTAYTNAFNTAIGAGAQDVGNSLTAQTTNAGLREQALSRMMGGATGLEGLGNYATTGGMNIANFLQQQGGLQQQQQQAQLNVPYSNYLAAQQYPFLTSQLMNSAVSTGATALPPSVASTNVGQTAQQGQTVTTQPNNWLASLLGTAIGTAGKLATAADGGGVPEDRPVLVGERGPEVFWPGKSGVVIPNEVLEAARALRTSKVGNAPPSAGAADGDPDVLSSVIGGATAGSTAGVEGPQMGWLSQVLGAAAPIGSAVAKAATPTTPGAAPPNALPPVPVAPAAEAAVMPATRAPAAPMIPGTAVTLPPRGLATPFNVAPALAPGLLGMAGIQQQQAA